jgi:hypothetical protein
MQRLPPFTTAIAVVFLLILQSSGAWSAESNSKKVTGCPGAPARAVDAAEDALRRHDEHTAIACLIEALRAARSRAPEAKSQKQETLIAPKGAWRNQP